MTRLASVVVALVGLLVAVELCRSSDAAAAPADGQQRCPAARRAAPSSASPANAPCRHFLNARFGTLTTPNFPHAFGVPFACSWIINATGFEPDSFVTLYLTQMHLTRGVKAVQYAFRNETHAVGRKELHELHATRERPYAAYRIQASYLEVLANLDDLANANVRVDRRSIDAYGFNITYEIQPSGSQLRPETCNAASCTFNGQCYASRDYSQFQCSCRAGFSGKHCQYGPQCNPDAGVNPCKNGGKCSYRVGQMTRCTCPLNYNGSSCEFRREFAPAKECAARLGLNCSHQCSLADSGLAECRCPLNYALKSDKSTCYPLVPLRALGYVEFDRPASWTDSFVVQGFAESLRSMMPDYTAGKLALASVQLLSPGRLQFVLVNSENYNMSWTTPATAAAAATRRFVRDSVPTPVPAALTPKQWSNALNTFANSVRHVHKKHWRVHETPVLVKSVTAVTVPALHIEWVRVDARQGRVREGYPFIVACSANGTDGVKLRWFKDGHPIDPSYSLHRNVSLFVHQERNLLGYYTLYLEVKQAMLADHGVYECQASDWGQTVRQGVFLDVIPPPGINLMPTNPSVAPNTQVTLTCRDTNHLARKTATKYVWLKNGQPVYSSCDEIIENLYPVGTLLKIPAIRESANYTCRAENGTTPVEVTTRVAVVRPGDACPEHVAFNATWPMTAAGSLAYSACPAGYAGVAMRYCGSTAPLADGASVVTDAAPEWRQPVFSKCVERAIGDVHHKLKLVSLGYRVAEIDAIVANFSAFVRAKVSRAASDPFLPGEGNAILELARNLESFLWKGSHLMEPPFWNTTAIDYFYALDALLSMPTSFFYPENVTPLLRLMQSHVALLALNPRAAHSRSGNPLDAIKSSQLRNSVIDIHANKRELKYKRSWPAFQSADEFRDVRQLAPARFVYSANATNFTSAFAVSEQFASRSQDGAYVCALLRLQPTNHSRSWDTGSCSAKQLPDRSTFECQCPQAGTVLLVHATRVTKDDPETSPDLWVLIWFAGAISLLVLIASVAALAAQWYRQRTLGDWFKVQLGIALFPVSLSYFLPPRLVIPNVYWAFALTVSLYLYLTTTLGVAVRGKLTFGRPSDESADYHRRLIGLTCGVPLALGTVHCLLGEFVYRLDFTSWLCELGSISGILFCLLYIALLTMNLAVLFFGVGNERCRFATCQAADPAAPDARYEATGGQRDSCLWLVGASLPFAGSLLLVHNGESTGAHCAATATHTLTMFLWSIIVLTFDGNNENALCFQSRARLVETSTVSEMLDATALVESPRHRSKDADDENDKRSYSVRKNRRMCIVSGLSEKMQRTKRQHQASSPLLRRAGLGPEVLRAFGLDHADKLLVKSASETRSANANGFGSAGQEKRSPDETHQDDSDSGFGPSGDGGSQKFISVDRVTEVLKVFRQLDWRFTMFGRSLTVSSNGDSFRSRKSTVSSATTAERGSATEIEHVERRETPRLPTAAAAVKPSFSMRRTRTRWKEDYGRKHELDSDGIGQVTINCKPYRGRCFIRCSPEKTGKRVAHLDCSNSPDETNSCCEQCRQNPETPPSERCSTHQPLASRTIYMQAVIETPPRRLENGSEYLDMDPAGSLAVDPHRIKRSQAYYNVRSLRSSPVRASVHPSMKTNRDKTYSSTPSLLVHGDKKIISGRVAKKYRNSFRMERTAGPNRIIHPGHF